MMGAGLRKGRDMADQVRESVSISTYWRTGYRLVNPAAAHDPAVEQCSKNSRVASGIPPRTPGHAALASRRSDRTRAFRDAGLYPGILARRQGSHTGTFVNPNAMVG
jgi:hypothetical protein